jgi:hypothetical protein
VGWIVALAPARSVILSAAKDRGLIAGVAGSRLRSHIEFVVSVDRARVLRFAQDDRCEGASGQGVGLRLWLITSLVDWLGTISPGSFAALRMTALGRFG